MADKNGAKPSRTRFGTVKTEDMLPAIKGEKEKQQGKHVRVHCHTNSFQKKHPLSEKNNEDLKIPELKSNSGRIHSVIFVTSGGRVINPRSTETEDCSTKK